MVCGGVYGTTAISNSMNDFFKDNYGRLMERYPKLQVTIWGRGKVPPKLGRYLQMYPEVRSLTWAEDYLREIAKTDIYLYPQRFGSGIQTKVQHMMAAGVATVARAETLEPLDVSHGESAFCFDSVATLDSALSVLIENRDMRESVGREGQRVMRRNFSREHVSRLFETMMKEIIGKE
jgi:glycosyltransferase involved in cell wall biosynthesis